MHGCTPALLSIRAVPLVSPAHSLARLALVPPVHASTCTHSRLHTCTAVRVRPPCPVPTHALMMHISPTSLPMPSASAYTCNHTHTPIPAPLCTVSCIPPVQSP